MGFTHEGTLRDMEYKQGRYLDLHQFSLLTTAPAATGIMASIESIIFPISRHEAAPWKTT